MSESDQTDVVGALTSVTKKLRRGVSDLALENRMEEELARDDELATRELYLQLPSTEGSSLYRESAFERYRACARLRLSIDCQDSGALKDTLTDAFRTTKAEVGDGS